MAYLKGGTFVDGKLYVQDAIVVNKIQTPDGKNLPYINIKNNFTGDAKNTAQSFVAGYSTINGGLDNAPIQYGFSVEENTENYVATNISFVGSNYKSTDTSYVLPTLDKIVIGNESGTLERVTDRIWAFVENKKQPSEE